MKQGVVRGENKLFSSKVRQYLENAVGDTYKVSINA